MLCDTTIRVERLFPLFELFFAFSFKAGIAYGCDFIDQVVVEVDSHAQAKGKFGFHPLMNRY